MGKIDRIIMPAKNIYGNPSTTTSSKPITPSSTYNTASSPVSRGIFFISSYTVHSYHHYRQ